MARLGLKLYGGLREYTGVHEWINRRNPCLSSAGRDRAADTARGRYLSEPSVYTAARLGACTSLGPISWGGIIFGNLVGHGAITRPEDCAWLHAERPWTEAVHLASVLEDFYHYGFPGILTESVLPLALRDDVPLSNPVAVICTGILIGTYLCLWPLRVGFAVASAVVAAASAGIAALGELLSMSWRPRVTAQEEATQRRQARRARPGGFPLNPAEEGAVSRRVLALARAKAARQLRATEDNASDGHNNRPRKTAAENAPAGSGRGAMGSTLFSRLPNELLTQILDDLEEKDLLRLAHTNRANRFGVQAYLGSPDELTRRHIATTATGRTAQDLHQLPAEPTGYWRAPKENTLLRLAFHAYMQRKLRNSPDTHEDRIPPFLLYGTAGLLSKAYACDDWETAREDFLLFLSLPRVQATLTTAQGAHTTSPAAAVTAQYALGLKAALIGLEGRVEDISSLLAEQDRLSRMGAPRRFVSYYRSTGKSEQYNDWMFSGHLPIAYNREDDFTLDYGLNLYRPLHLIYAFAIRADNPKTIAYLEENFAQHLPSIYYGPGAALAAKAHKVAAYILNRPNRTGCSNLIENLEKRLVDMIRCDPSSIENIYCDENFITLQNAREMFAAPRDQDFELNFFRKQAALGNVILP